MINAVIDYFEQAKAYLIVPVHPTSEIETVNAYVVDAAIIIMIILFVISTALSILLAPKPPKPPNDEAQAQEAPQNDPSKYVPVIFGRARIKDPIIAWYGNTKAVPIMSDQGGKK